MSKKLNEITGYKVAGLTIDLMSKLRDGVIDVEELERFVTLSPKERKKFFGEKEESILKLISTGENLKLDACDGKKTIYDSKDVFAWKDDDFKNWKVNTTGPATAEISADIYEMAKDATFAEMFSSLGDLHKLCLTQSQILNFIAKHKNWLRTEGYGTFFLFKANGNFFVASVNVNSDGLSVHVIRLEDDIVWNAEGRHRIVIPQLDA
ncbi:MAG: hypothetical protein ABH951_03120 [Patescibacteria group bacterium]